MCSFHYGLFLCGIRDACVIFYLKLCTKFLEKLRSLSRGIISFQRFWQAKYEKQVKRCCTTSLYASPVRAVAMMTWEKVSTVTWTKDNFPNDKTWVTSICQSALGLRPRGLTPIGKLFREVGQCEQEQTISWADSREIWNWYLNAVAFWWWSEWEAQASLKTEITVTLVNKSARSFKEFKGPGSPEWARMWPTKNAQCSF